MINILSPEKYRSIDAVTAPGDVEISSPAFAEYAIA